MSRYPDAIWRPTTKHGYRGDDTHLKQGLVIHSVEGTLAGAFSVLDGSREASWHFTIPKAGGKPYQHVDTDNIAWTNGSYESNRRFWGIECEGGGPNNPGEPLTEPQYTTLLMVVRWMWQTHAMAAPQRQVNLWEHNEMTRFGSSPTSCPSGRIPWERIISELQEDDMGMTDEERQVLHENLSTIYKQIGHLRGLLGLPTQFGDVTPQELATYPSPVLEALRGLTATTLLPHRHRFSGETEE